uniref:Uncharacterized protein n=1 Tax=Lepeophtheirus salmonis TaxID=72036 RepID=A0A0K2U7I6_LEPSM
MRIDIESLHRLYWYPIISYKRDENSHIIITIIGYY